jgi:hypothetical protein
MLLLATQPFNMTMLHVPNQTLFGWLVCKHTALASWLSPDSVGLLLLLLLITS